MRKLLHLLLLLPVFVMGQGADQNFIRSTVYNDSVPSGPLPGAPIPQTTNIAYFDGLGRPIGTSAVAQSTTGRNIVRPIAYDLIGRQSKKYLPYVSLGHSLEYEGSEETLMEYYGTPAEWQNGNPALEATSNPYTETIYEPSPLNRVLEQGAPGNSWAVSAGHTVKYAYLLNITTTADRVKYFKAAAVWDSGNNYYATTLTNAAGTKYYPASTLSRTIMKNENWTGGKTNTVEEYRNGEGQVVLKRAFDDAGNPIDTYYAYDQFGNLTYVIPPLATGNISTAILNGLCYQYRYDDRNRLVEKKLPGKQWEFIVYDVLGRVVATGPAFSPFNDLTTVGWLVTKYDAFNRPLLTAWVPVGTSLTTSTRKALQAGRDLQLTNLNEAKTAGNTTVGGIAFRYTTVAYPASGYHVLTVNYYDNYDYPEAPSDFTTPVEGQKIYYNNSTRKPKGLPTGSWIRVLERSTSYHYELSWSQYDYRGRPVRSRMLNHLGGYTQADTRLGFSGRAEYTVKTHKRTASDPELSIKDSFTYDSQQRVVKHTHQIGNGTPELLAFNTYDEIGQLINRKTGGTDLTGSACFQKTDFSYNTRGWLKGINNTNDLTDGPGQDLFAFRINYDTTEGPAAGNAVPLYNGNISETYWRSANDNILRKYSYGYDSQNRLLASIYQRPGASPSPIWNSYNEQVSYDANGNITTLYRTGGVDSPNPQVIDDLLFAYETASDRLLKVTDHEASIEGFKDDDATGPDDAPDYVYDANGNMTGDRNKKILKIIYNHLNLPTQITFDIPGNNFITYIYDSVGTKVGKTVVSTGSSGINTLRTDYLTGFQYEGVKLQFFPTAQGYVRVNPAGSYNYVYNITDHLGNVRLSYGADPQDPGKLRIIEENNYYPYGLKHENYNVGKLDYGTNSAGIALLPANALKYKYKFNGQEFQEEQGLNMTAMDFRQYDNAIGRFVGMDALSETGYSVTPYHFASGNPVYFTDPSGLRTISADVANALNPTSTDTGVPAWAEGMWDNTPDGTDSFWTNVGGGGFENSNGSGWLDSGTGDFFATPSYQLDNIDVVAGSNSDWLSAAQEAVYNTSYYNYVSDGKNINDYTGLVFSQLEYIPGSFRLSTTVRGFSPKYYGNGWGGNQFATTYKFAGVGRSLGYAGVGIGYLLDSQGVRNYYNPAIGPNSPDSVHPNKRLLNLAIGLYGMEVSPIPSLVYNGVDMFYPGGWTEAMRDQSTLNKQNLAINPNWQLWPGAMKL